MNHSCHVGRSEESESRLQILRDAPSDDRANGFQLKFKQTLSFSSNNFFTSILGLFKKDVIFVVSNFFPQKRGTCFYFQ